MSRRLSRLTKQKSKEPGSEPTGPIPLMEPVRIWELACLSRQVRRPSYLYSGITSSAWSVPLRSTYWAVAGEDALIVNWIHANDPLEVR